MRRWVGVAVVVLGLAAPAWAQQAVTFQWDAGAGADGYLLQWGTAPGGVDAQQDVGPVLTTAATFSPGTYYVRVWAYNAVGTSQVPSNEVTLVVTVPPPPPPTDPCLSDPLAVSVLAWPTSKKGLPTYAANYTIVAVRLQARGQTVLAATFTDTRGCVQTVVR